MAVGGAIGAVGVWAVWATVRDRGRQRAWAATREPTTREEFVDQMIAAGVRPDVAEWLLGEVDAYYTRPLTPYASDRVYRDLRIDPDDIGQIALRYEKTFGVRLVAPVPLPADPNWAELCVALQQHSFS